ncbi:MAG: saccharopine dehydrogenase NADP-binding domain-containing protein, partial [Acidobacteriota bacterium]
MTMRILMMGGYGEVGYKTSKILLSRTDAELVIAGRCGAKARSAAAELAQTTRSSRVRGDSVDAFDREDVLSAFESVGLVVICVPLAGLGDSLARAAFEAGVDYIDINANRRKQAYLESVTADIERKGLTFVSEAGLGPGVPSLLVRYAHEQLGTLETVNIGAIFRDSKISRGSAMDMLVELGARHRVLEDGIWRTASLSDSKTIDFGGQHGEERCHPFEFFELVKLPVENMGIRNLGFYVAEFNPIADLLTLVWRMTGLYRSKLGLNLGAKLVMRSSRFTRPPFRTVIQADATTRDGNRLRIQVGHHDAYAGTAIPLAACVLQMLDADEKIRVGLHLMGHILRTDRFLKDLRSMGMGVTMVREEATRSAVPPGFDPGADTVRQGGKRQATWPIVQ